MSNDESYAKDKHLRLTLQIKGKKATVLDADIIDKPLVTPSRVLGPFVVSTVFGGKLVWVDNMQDPFVRRGMPRPGEHEHHYETMDTATIVTRVPIPKKVMPNDFHVAFHRITKHLPERTSDLAKLLRAPHPEGFKHLSSINLPTLQKRPDWEKIMQRAGLKPQ